MAFAKSVVSQLKPHRREREISGKFSPFEHIEDAFAKKTGSLGQQNFFHDLYLGEKTKTF